MINIFTHTQTSRLTYISQQIFTHWLQQEVRFFTNENEFANAGGIKINYSSASVTAHVHIIPTGLLSETCVTKTDPPVKVENHIPLLFPNEKEGFFPFDFFSAVFWMLSRMEEYATEKKDHFNRFTAQQSFAHRHDFLELPVVDIWLQQFIRALPAEEAVKLPTDDFKFKCTIDVDNAYAIYGKPYWRQVLASVRDVITGKPGFINQRWKIWRGNLPDPNNTYAFLEETSQRHKIPFTFFYLLGDYGKRDKNLTWNSKELKKLVEQNITWAQLGVHPCFVSYNNAKIIQRDVQRLREISGMRVNQSRQHYLRFSFPHTFRYLYDAGIRNDYSLGFHDLPGFRAGTGRSFYFYDVENEHETDLLLHPFVIMDGTLHDYMKLSPAQALQKTEELFAVCKKYGTPVCTLWHNDTVNNMGAWQNWQPVFMAQFALASR